MLPTCKVLKIIVLKLERIQPDLLTKFQKLCFTNENFFKHPKSHGDFRRRNFSVFMATIISANNYEMLPTCKLLKIIVLKFERIQPDLLTKFQKLCFTSENFFKHPKSHGDFRRRNFSVVMATIISTNNYEMLPTCILLKIVVLKLEIIQLSSHQILKTLLYK